MKKLWENVKEEIIKTVIRSIGISKKLVNKIHIDKIS